MNDMTNIEIQVEMATATALSDNRRRSRGLYEFLPTPVLDPVLDRVVSHGTVVLHRSL